MGGNEGVRWTGGTSEWAWDQLVSAVKLKLMDVERKIDRLIASGWMNDDNNRLVDSYMYRQIDFLFYIFIDR